MYNLDQVQIIDKPTETKKTMPQNLPGTIFFFWDFSMRLFCPGTFCPGPFCPAPFCPGPFVRISG